jgi:hypothetical protein
VPEWAEGLALPLPDLVAVLDYIVSWYAKRGVKLAAEAKRLRTALAKLADGEGLLHL